MTETTKSVDLPQEAATVQDNAEHPASHKKAEWQPLGYEKLTAADVQTGLTGVGADGGFYS